MIRDLLAGVTITKRTVLAGLVVSVVVLGAGLGLFGPGSSGSNDTTQPDMADGPADTPTPPPVTATPPTGATGSTPPTEVPDPETATPTAATSP